MGILVPVKDSGRFSNQINNAFRAGRYTTAAADAAFRVENRQPCLRTYGDSRKFTCPHAGTKAKAAILTAKETVIELESGSAVLET